jgi:hypothetical protein
MQKRKVLKSEYVPRANSLKVKRVTLQKQREKRLKRIFFFLFFVMIFSALLYLLLSPRFYISSFSIETKNDVFRGKAELVVKEYMEEKTLYLFPHKNIFLFSSSSVEEKLKASFSKISSVSVGKEISSKKISLETHAPLYKVISRNGNIFYISDQGIVYRDSEEDRELLTITEEARTISSLNASSSFAGISFAGAHTSDFLFSFESSESQSLPPDIFNKINFYKEKFRAARLPILSITFYKEGIVALSLKDGEVRIDFTEKETEVWGRFSAALAHEKFSQRLRARESEIEYIDLRFGSKIFYKFQNSTPLSSETAASSSLILTPSSVTH